MRLLPWAALLPCLLLASAASGQGRLQDAAAAPEAPVTEEQRQALKHIQTAQDKLNARDFMGAVMAADRAIGLQPENPKAYNLKATALNRLGRYQDAIAAAERSHELNPMGNSSVYDNLAYAQLYLGTYVDAVNSAGRAIEMSQDDAQAYLIRAYAYEQIGDRKAMLADIEEAARIDPRNVGRMLEAARRGEPLFVPPSAEPAQPQQGGLPSGALWGVVALLALTSAAGWYLYASRQPAATAAARPSPASGAAESEPEGLLAGKYEFRRIIGKGGMGEVWDAKDHSLNRIVAIKKMSAELGALGSQAREYYLKEARTVASLHHPHIIGIYEILDLKEGVYLVFEMASGKTVQHLLAESRRLSLGKSKRILRPVCDALDFAHSRGVVHRDLKPANIMLTDQGFVKVMDFGIARRVEDKVARGPDGIRDPSQPPRAIALDHTRTIVGTPAYMPPESEQGVVTSVSDIYSLGICFYEMLTGALPYPREAGMLKYERSFPKARSLVAELPGPIDELIFDALDPNPESRIPSAREFLARLDKLPEVPKTTDRLG